jgi:hypothetical protein
VAPVLAARIESYARQTAIRYLSQRFASDVELQALHIRFPENSLLRLVLGRGRGISARIEGQGLSLRLKDRPDSFPLFAIQKFRCDVNLESLLHPPAVVSQVFVDGMQIPVPEVIFWNSRGRPRSGWRLQPGQRCSRFRRHA